MLELYNVEIISKKPVSIELNEKDGLVRLNHIVFEEDLDRLIGKHISSETIEGSYVTLEVECEYQGKKWKIHFPVLIGQGKGDAISLSFTGINGGIFPMNLEMLLQLQQDQMHQSDKNLRSSFVVFPDPLAICITSEVEGVKNLKKGLPASNYMELSEFYEAILKKVSALIPSEELYSRLNINVIDSQSFGNGIAAELSKRVALSKDALIHLREGVAVGEGSTLDYVKKFFKSTGAKQTLEYISESKVFLHETPYAMKGNLDLDGKYHLLPYSKEEIARMSPAERFTTMHVLPRFMATVTRDRGYEWSAQILKNSSNPLIGMTNDFMYTEGKYSVLGPVENIIHGIQFEELNTNQIKFESGVIMTVLKEEAGHQAANSMPPSARLERLNLIKGLKRL
jgi:hypothetical protein